MTIGASSPSPLLINTKKRKVLVNTRLHASWSILTPFVTGPAPLPTIYSPCDLHAFKSSARQVWLTCVSFTSTMKAKPICSRNTMRACLPSHQTSLSTHPAASWQSSTQTYPFSCLSLPAWSLSFPVIFFPAHPHNGWQRSVNGRGCPVPWEGQQGSALAQSELICPAQTPVGTNPLSSKTGASQGIAGWNLFKTDTGRRLGTLSGEVIACQKQVLMEGAAACGTPRGTVGTPQQGSGHHCPCPLQGTPLPQREVPAVPSGTSHAGAGAPMNRQ